MAGIHNITITTGATYRAQFYIRDSNKRPVNLTGATPLMRLKPKTTDPAVDLNSINGKLVVSNATAGELSLHLTATETAGYSWGSGRFYFTITYSNSDVINYLEGEVKLVPLGG